MRAARPSMSSATTALAWMALAAVAVFVAGFPGHRVPFFTGDLAFHVGTAHTMHLGHLNGSGPYVGLPSYYGGTFVLVLAFFGWVGIDPGHALMVVSWAEPLLWVGASAVLARTLWPGRTTAQLTFAGFVCWAAGTQLGMSEQWVNAPNVAGQVFWPLFPRDVALMLVLGAVAAAVSQRWILTGLLVGLCISVQAQVGLWGLASCGLAVLVTSHRSDWFKRAGAIVAIAVVGSCWWWLPRAVWFSRFGLDLTGSETRIDLAPHLASVWKSYGLLLPLAGVGAIHALVARSTVAPALRFRLWWAAATIPILTVAAVVPGDLLSMRRALVISAIPITAVAIDGLTVVSELVRGPRWATPAVAVALAGAVVAMSIPVLYTTRTYARDHWANARYGAIGYVPSVWDPVWAKVAHGKSPLLAEPGDAAMAWFRTGRPVLYVPRPGYLKLGFDSSRATGWDERARRDAVTTAFTAGPQALCNLAKERGAGALLLRSRKGGLGVVDFSGGTAVNAGLAGPGVSQFDRNDVVVGIVPPGAKVDLHPVRTVNAQAISVWQAAAADGATGTFTPAATADGARGTFTLVSGGRRLEPSRVVPDGAGQRIDFDQPPHGSSVSLVNTTGQSLLLLRVVAFVPWDGTDVPASVVSRGQFCAKFGK